MLMDFNANKGSDNLVSTKVADKTTALTRAIHIRDEASGYNGNGPYSNFLEELFG
jgi:hypothetical protein